MMTRTRAALVAGMFALGLALTVVPHHPVQAATNPAAIKLLHPVFGPWTLCDKFVERLRYDMYGSIATIDYDTEKGGGICSIAYNSLRSIHPQGTLATNKYIALALRALNNALTLKETVIADTNGVQVVSEHGTPQDVDTFYGIFNNDLNHSYAEETRFWYDLNHTM